MSRMAKWMVVGLAVVASIGCGGSDVNAVKVKGPYTNYFDGANALGDWLFYDPSGEDSIPGKDVRTLWAVDALPEPPGGARYSGSGSLNYNNNRNYDEGAKTGIVISPFINIEDMKDPVLAFRCNYDTETQDETNDQRFVEIGELDGDGKPEYFLRVQLSTNPGSAVAGRCEARAWHLHVVRLNKDWDDVHVTFRFTSDGDNNGYGGWYVDNVQVVESGNVDYGAGNVGGGTEPGRTVRIYGTNFDGADQISNWTPAVETGKVGWGYDGTPTAVGGTGELAYRSAPNSLNYNNGLNYDTPGEANSGAVVSPVVDITGYANPRLRFACIYDTDSNSTHTDQRRLEFVNPNDGTVIFGGALAHTGYLPEFKSCGLPKQWHTHEIGLNPDWNRIQLRFSFNTMNASANAYSGHFIDDLEIVGETTQGVSGWMEGRRSGSGKKKGGCAGGTDAAGLDLTFVLLIAAFVVARYRVR